MNIKQFKEFTKIGYEKSFSLSKNINLFFKFVLAVFVHFYIIVTQSHYGLITFFLVKYRLILV